MTELLGNINHLSLLLLLLLSSSVEMSAGEVAVTTVTPSFQLPQALDGSDDRIRWILTEGRMGFSTALLLPLLKFCGKRVVLKSVWYTLGKNHVTSLSPNWWENKLLQSHYQRRSGHTLPDGRNRFSPFYCLFLLGWAHAILSWRYLSKHTILTVSFPHWREQVFAEELMRPNYLKPEKQTTFWLLSVQ